MDSLWFFIIDNEKHEILGSWNLLTYYKSYWKLRYYHEIKILELGVIYTT